MISAVFDTNIYFQAAVSKRGPAYECWRLVLDGSVRAFISEQCIAEIRSLFVRPRLRHKFSILTDQLAEELLIHYRTNSILVRQIERRFEFSRDPADESFINLALTCDAKYLVSRDRDLLDLMLDQAFTSQFPELKIVSPFEFLQMVRAK